MNTTIQNKLKELEKTRKNFWNVSVDTGKFLNLLVKTKRPKQILELGTSNGYSTIWLALAARELNAHITTIEYWPERVEMAKNNLTECNLNDYITFFQGKVHLKLPELKTKYDFVFIDACKEEYIQYIKILETMLKEESIIISDNIESHRAQLTNFLEYMEKNPNFENVFLPLGDGVLMSYYKSSSFS